MPEFTKGKWLIHEGHFDGITLNPKQYYIYPDNGEPYKDDFIVCAEKGDAMLVANAPELYEAVCELLDYAYEALELAGGENEIRGKAPRILREIREYQQLIDRINGKEIKN